MLPRLAAALRPGRRLVAVALLRVELLRDLPVGAAAAGAQTAVAVSLGLARLAGAAALTKDDAGMPVATPELIRAGSTNKLRPCWPGRVCGGCSSRRYLLEWARPTSESARTAGLPLVLAPR